MFLLYHAYVYLEFLILACTIYILAPFGKVGGCGADACHANGGGCGTRACHTNAGSCGAQACGVKGGSCGAQACVAKV